VPVTWRYKRCEPGGRRCCGRQAAAARARAAATQRRSRRPRWRRAAALRWPPTRPDTPSPAPGRLLSHEKPLKTLRVANTFQHPEIRSARVSKIVHYYSIQLLPLQDQSGRLQDSRLCCRLVLVAPSGSGVNRGISAVKKGDAPSNRLAAESVRQYAGGNSAR